MKIKTVFSLATFFLVFSLFHVQGVQACTEAQIKGFVDEYSNCSNKKADAEHQIGCDTAFNKHMEDCAGGPAGSGSSGFMAKDNLKATGALSGVGTPKTLEEAIGGVINIALSILGIIFLVLLVYGGYIWMIARGDESEAEKAKKIITMAVIGLIIVLMAYAISYFIFSKLLKASGVSV